ncbi:hypothetical protein ABZS66_37390 [Dactylosporangium sp. NPDC005572]|uniref:hypothetical protein n=1 Tax=Dactylosporangium sp. NPDC005572 TaxID=3156889 RepID=UPI0033BBF729
MTTMSTATVETLTAEVRVLMVGSRQITAGVYAQLDVVAPDLIEPLGRVSPRDARAGWVHIVGRHTGDGTLVAAATPAVEEAIRFKLLGEIKLALPGQYQYLEREQRMREWGPAETKRLADLADQWSALPLIILAGLR